MAGRKDDLSILKDKGFLQQRQDNMLSMRLKVVGGKVDAKTLRMIADASEKYGSGYIHLTTRQQIEIPFVKLEDAEVVSKDLEGQDVYGGSSGKKVRAIVACQGNSVCKHGLIDCQGLAIKIDGMYFGKPVPKKLKIAITGCPSACAKPQDNDLGIMGIRKPEQVLENCVGCGLCAKACKVGSISIHDGRSKIDNEICVLCGACIDVCRKHALRAERTGYTIFVGGSMGRRPKLGIRLVELVDEEQLFSILQRTFEYYTKEGLDGERLGELIERKGQETFREYVIR